MSNISAISIEIVNEEVPRVYILPCPSPLESSVVIPATFVEAHQMSSHLHVNTDGKPCTHKFKWKTCLKTLCVKFIRWHVDRWKRRISRSIIIFRFLPILVGLLLMIQFAIVNANQHHKSPSFIIQCLYGAEYPMYEIMIIIYVSVAAALGVSLELYLFLIFGIVNVIKASLYCDVLTVNVIYAVKLVSLFLATELVYQNFRRLPGYEERYDQSARYMLHQALLFSATMIFLVARGLRIVYLGANGTCAFYRDTCGFNDLYRPHFNVTDPCEDTFIDYLSGREELRILRNWLLLNMAFHAVFNRGFFDFAGTDKSRWPILRFILYILFVLLTFSLIAVNIWPFEYHNFKIVFDTIECVLFTLTIGLMIYNLIYCSRWRNREEPQGELMQSTPTISPQI